MLKVLKVILDAGNQTLDVPNDCEIVANLHASLDGVVLLIRVPDAPQAPAQAAPEPEAAIIPEVVSSPEETSLEA